MKNSIVDLEAIKIAIEALEKQIPKRVTNERCPSCDMDVVGSGHYCWNCGQKLDWRK